MRRSGQKLAKNVSLGFLSCWQETWMAKSTTSAQASRRAGKRFPASFWPQRPTHKARIASGSLAAPRATWRECDGGFIPMTLLLCPRPHSDAAGWVEKLGRSWGAFGQPSYLLATQETQGNAFRYFLAWSHRPGGQNLVNFTVRTPGDLSEEINLRPNFFKKTPGVRTIKLTKFWPPR